MASKGVSITLRDLRLAKLDKRVRINPCSSELESYINALAQYDGECDRIPQLIRRALTDCVEQKVFSCDLDSTELARYLKKNSILGLTDSTSIRSISFSKVCLKKVTVAEAAI